MLWYKCGLFCLWNDLVKDIVWKLMDIIGVFFLVVDGEYVIGIVMIGYDGYWGLIYYLGVDFDI